MVFSIKTEKHLRVVQVARVLDRLTHTVKNALIKLYLVDLELHMHQKLKQELKLFLQCL
jgi:hypothetical protein